MCVMYNKNSKVFKNLTAKIQKIIDICKFFHKKSRDCGSFCYFFAIFQ